MRFQEKLHEYQKKEIWEEYCGFLTIKPEEFMTIQRRLLEEQIGLWCASALGQSILKGKKPATVEEFRSMVPLTTYENYATLLLSRRAEALPEEPVTWVNTAWEGGIHPVKVAPYTKAMLDTFQHNIISCLILSTSREEGEFDVRVGDHMLYALAPLPYVTGLIPLLLRNEIDIEFLPSARNASKMSLQESNELGFRLGMRKGVELFFGLGSILSFVSQNVAELTVGFGRRTGKKLSAVSPEIALRSFFARRRCRREHRELLPKDLFELRGFMCGGTDARCYKDALERMWGIAPMELLGGTELTCIGCETWSREGVYLFPDACFYEFIPEDEMDRSRSEPNYQPQTVLWDEVQPGAVYELVITVFKGGAFARYRVGDILRCTGIGSEKDRNEIPRFEYVDRVPQVIDIAGFTRITENSVNQAIDLSRLPVERWTAKKEFTEDGRPYLHLYVELQREELAGSAVSSRVLQEQLSTHFRYFDQDYEGVKKILGMEPLKITLLKCGTFAEYEKRYGVPIFAMNPKACDINNLLACHQAESGKDRGGSDAAV